ncbi:MAG: HNH endonuclease [Candidatus Omnitrophota bacterium]|nr:MAG: HNH endonuclease [Candidatus Omnitrophota bacterium]
MEFDWFQDRRGCRCIRVGAVFIEQSVSARRTPLSCVRSGAETAPALTLTESSWNVIRNRTARTRRVAADRAHRHHAQGANCRVVEEGILIVCRLARKPTPIFVEYRANYCSEYCRFPQSVSLHKHEPDHIVPCQHGGNTEAGNLALSCMRCNRYRC